MKNIYLLEVGQLDERTNTFNFYDKVAFSSMKKVNSYIDNVIDVNNGYNKTFPSSVLDYVSHVDYSCLSTCGKALRKRFAISKIEVNKYAR